MFCETCEHCGTRQLFGYRRLAGFGNESPGVMALTWTCSSCRSLTVTKIGHAVH